MPGLSSADNIQYVDVAQYTEVYKNFASGQQDLVKRCYEVFDDTNRRFYGGRLPTPIFKIPMHGMSRRTLGRYARKTETGEENIIEINKDLIVLNTWERVSETIKHEVIHFYLVTQVGGRGCNESGHGKPFQMEASRLGIPCEGSHGYGSECKMPMSTSTSVEWRCACGACKAHKSGESDSRAICDDCLHPMKPGGYLPEETVLLPFARAKGGKGMLNTFKALLVIYERFQTLVEESEQKNRHVLRAALAKTADLEGKLAEAMTKNETYQKLLTKTGTEEKDQAAIDAARAAVESSVKDLESTSIRFALLFQGIEEDEAREKAKEKGEAVPVVNEESPEKSRGEFLELEPAPLEEAPVKS